MPSLRDLQLDWSRALLGGATRDAAASIAADGLDPEARLAIYRHHVVSTLGDVLRTAFPVVCRLVDARFFAWVAQRFVHGHPPSGPCLAEYGAAFPAFLGEFPACRHLAYLPDVARLEWAVHRAGLEGDAVRLAPTALADIEPECVGDLVLRLEPSLALIASPWPVDAIWRAHRDDGDVDPVDLDAGDAFVQVCRAGDEVIVRSLTRAEHAFRRALVEGRRLAGAAAVALAADPAFDLVTALRDLFAEHVLTGFTLSSPTKEVA